MKRPIEIMGLLLLPLLFVSCTSLRKHTYPPDFAYLEEEKLHSAMWEVAKHSEAIHRIMDASSEGALSAEQRDEVVGHLTAMEKATGTLTTQSVESNHPVIAQNIHKFRSDIQMALAAAEREPPNYYLAGSITGSCLYCHKSNRQRP